MIYEAGNCSTVVVNSKFSGNNSAALSLINLYDCLMVTSATPAISDISRWDFLSFEAYEKKITVNLNVKCHQNMKYNLFLNYTQYHLITTTHISNIWYFRLSFLVIWSLKDVTKQVKVTIWKSFWLKQDTVSMNELLCLKNTGT